MYLWNKVVQGCLAAKPSKSCLQVEPSGAKYIIFDENKDLLLIPTVLISGIESNEPEPHPGFFLPNFWQDASIWAQYYIPNTTGDVWVGLAVNSANSRSEDQLHMHICSLNPKAIDEIKKNILQISTQFWHAKPFLNLVSTHMYNAIKVPDLTQNPFVQVFNGTAGSANAYQKADTNVLVVVQRLLGTQKPIFYVLYNQDGGAAESLLDGGNCGIVLP